MKPTTLLNLTGGAKRLALASILGLACGFSTVGEVIAGVLYGSDSQGNYFSIDISTGAATLITSDGSTYNSNGGATEIEIDPATGIGYAQNPPNPGSPFSGNIFDGVTGTSLGPTNPTAHAYQGLEYVANTLYAAGWDGGGTAGIYILDPLIGADTFVADTGSLDPINGLAYDVSTGVMYGSIGRGVGDLVTIDLITGALSLVGNMGIVAGSIEFGWDGNLYAGGGQANSGEIWQIDKSTAAATFVGNTGLGTTVTGLTLVPEPIPEPLTILGAPTAAGFGAFFKRELNKKKKGQKE